MREIERERRERKMKRDERDRKRGEREERRQGGFRGETGKKSASETHLSDLLERRRENSVVKVDDERE